MRRISRRRTAVNSALRTPRSALEAPSLRLGAQRFQFLHRVAAQAVQLADGQHHVAFQTVLQLAQLERRAAQPPELPSQPVAGERLLLRRGQRHRRVAADHVAQFIPRNKGERFAGQPMHLHLERALELRRVSLEALSQPAVQFRVARLPKLIAHVNALEVNVPPSKAQFRKPAISAFGLRTSHFINPSALFLLLGMARVEDHPVARLQRRLQLHPDALVLDAGHFAEEHPALLAEAAHEPAPGYSCRGTSRCKARARTPSPSRSGRHPLAAPRRPTGRALPIDARDVGDVFRRLEPALDLQGRHADPHQLRQHFQPGQVLRAEQILPVA